MPTTIEAVHLDGLRSEAEEAVTRLAERVYKVPAGELTRKQIAYLLNMELGCMVSKLEISVGEVRPTSINYSSSRYDATITIDMGGAYGTLRRMVEESENPIEGLIEAILLARSYVADKFVRTETMLRTMVNDAIRTDGLQQPPEARAAK